MNREEWSRDQFRIVLDVGGTTATRVGGKRRSLFIPWRAIGKVTNTVHSRGTRAAGINSLVLAAVAGAYATALAQSVQPDTGSPPAGGTAAFFGILEVIPVLLPDRVIPVGVYGHAGQALWTTSRLGRSEGDENEVFRGLMPRTGCSLVQIDWEVDHAESGV